MSRTVGIAWVQLLIAVWLSAVVVAGCGSGGPESSGGDAGNADGANADSPSEAASDAGPPSDASSLDASRTDSMTGSDSAPSSDSASSSDTGATPDSGPPSDSGPSPADSSPSDSSPTDSFVATYPVGGSVTGLATGETVTLQDGAGETVTVTAPSQTFTFPTLLASGASYTVTVSGNPSAPVAQTCLINGLSSATGVVAGGPVSVQVTCTTNNSNSYPLQVTVTGLNAGTSGLTLADDQGDVISLTQVSSSPIVQSFKLPYMSGSSYSVVVQQDPSYAPIAQTCTFANGKGSIQGAVANAAVNLAVSCVTTSFSGTVTGLVGGFTLSDGDGDTLTVNTNGPFTFPTPQLTSNSYTISVVANPTYPPYAQTCKVANPTGSVVTSAVPNLAVTCTTNDYAVGGTVSFGGSNATGSVTLTLNDNAVPPRTQTITVSSSGNGTFAFPGDPSGSSYTVSITGTSDAVCSFSNGSTTTPLTQITSSDQNNLSVTCAGACSANSDCASGKCLFMGVAFPGSAKGVCDSNDPALQPALQLETAKVFAPLIYLHPNEQYFPSAVDLALANETVNCYPDNLHQAMMQGAPSGNAISSFPASALLQAGPDGKPVVQINNGGADAGPPPEPWLPPSTTAQQESCYLTTPVPLASATDCDPPPQNGCLDSVPPANVPGGCLLANTPPTGPGSWCSDPKLNYLFGDPAGVRNNTVPVYLQIYSLGPGVFNVQYKTFYPYNYGKKACESLFGSSGCNTTEVQDDNHIGDWEGMAIQFTDFAPTAVRTQAHSTSTIGTTYTAALGWSGDPAFSTAWPDGFEPPALQWTGNHPIVYSALGSHGIWGSPRANNYMTLPTGQPLLDYAAAGQAWQTWLSNPVVVSNEGIENGWWAMYKGRWGNPPGNVPSNPSQCTLAMGGLLQNCGLCTNDLVTEFPLNPGPGTPPTAGDANALPPRYVSFASGSTPVAGNCPTAAGGSYGGPSIQLESAQGPDPNLIVSTNPGNALPDCEVANRAAEFQIVPGLAPGGVSVQSVSQPGTYWDVPPTSASGGTLVVAQSDGSDAFNKSATFKMPPALASNASSALGIPLSIQPLSSSTGYLTNVPGGLSLVPSAPANPSDATFSIIQPPTTYRPGDPWNLLDPTPITTQVQPGSAPGATYVFWVRNHTLATQNIEIWETVPFHAGVPTGCYSVLNSSIANGFLTPGMEYGFTSTLFTYGNLLRVDLFSNGSNIAEICDMNVQLCSVIEALELGAAVCLGTVLTCGALDVAASVLPVALAVGGAAGAGYAAYLGITDPNQLSSDAQALQNAMQSAAQCGVSAVSALVNSLILNGADNAKLIGQDAASGVQSVAQSLANLVGGVCSNNDDDRTVSLWRHLDGSYVFCHQDGPC
jgi:hypothetical protein